MIKYWANLLHLYQPPTQDREVLDRINNSCYLPLLRMLDNHPHIKTTFNISGVLLELLDQSNHQETLQLFRKLAFKGNIEIIGTAKFHPLLPIIPEKEVARQIQLNRETNLHYFGKDTSSGFFPPELAINDNILKIIKELGYTWTIVSGIASELGKWFTDKIQKNQQGLIIFYRDDIISNKIAFNHIPAEDFVNKVLLGENYKAEESKEGKYCKRGIKQIPNSEFLITALDGETFGHHIANYQDIFLQQVYHLIEYHPSDIKTVFLSDLIDLFPTAGITKPKPSSWSTTGKDLEHGVYFPLWSHPSNPVHKVQNKIAKALDKLISICDTYYLKNLIDQNYYNSARYFYDRSLYSCSSWWASMRPSWSPILIFKGANMMMLAALNAKLALTYAKVKEEYIKDESEEIYDQITNYFGQLLTELSKQSSNLLNAKIS